jgi:Transcriptional Coactivator p15 (PC4)
MTAATEPIVVGKFWKNRKGDMIVVAIKSYEGIVFCDVRQFFQNDAGVSCPTKKGIAISLRKLGELVDLLEKTISRAHELGLLNERQP